MLACRVVVTVVGSGMIAVRVIMIGNYTIVSMVMRCLGHHHMVMTRPAINHHGRSEALRGERKHH